VPICRSGPADELVARLCCNLLSGAPSRRCRRVSPVPNSDRAYVHHETCVVDGTRGAASGSWPSRCAWRRICARSSLLPPGRGAAVLERSQRDSLSPVLSSPPAGGARLHAGPQTVTLPRRSPAGGALGTGTRCPSAIQQMSAARRRREASPESRRRGRSTRTM